VPHNSARHALVHHHLLAGIVRDGRAPALAALAEAASVSPADVAASLGRLAEGHGLVLHPGTTEVWIAHPFSLSPTGVWVAADDGRGWWAPCLWCATGIAALVARPVVVHARIGGEAEAVAIPLADGRAGDDVVVHFALPPRDAWSNVVHYCACVLPFRAAADVDAWCARHRLPRGEVVPLAQVADLGCAWYGRHLDRDWRKWTVPEAQAIFERVGLTGPFWALPTADGTF